MQWEKACAGLIRHSTCYVLAFWSERSLCSVFQNKRNRKSSKSSCRTCLIISQMECWSCLKQLQLWDLQASLPPLSKKKTQSHSKSKTKAGDRYRFLATLKMHHTVVWVIALQASSIRQKRWAKKKAETMRWCSTMKLCLRLLEYRAPKIYTLFLKDLSSSIINKTPN